MIGAAIAYNLKKYMNYREKKVKVVAMEMRKDENQSVMNNLFCVFNIDLPMENIFSCFLTKKLRCENLWSGNVWRYSGE